MVKIATTYILCFLFCGIFSKTLFGQTIIANQEEGTIRIMSYNIRNAKGLDDVTDYKRIADIIIKISPDVIALQEIDSVTNRSKQVDVLAEINRHTNMYATYSASIDFDGGKYGIGILSKEKPLSFRRISLPGREEARSLLIAEFEHYIFCCTHFSLNEEDRLASVKIIDEEIAIDKPAFLAGDINALPISVVIDEFRKNWAILSEPKQPTFPANNPKETIDYIFGDIKYGRKFSISQSLVMDEPIASDHVPLFVDVKLKD